jgi:hypothetical protein
MLRIYEYSITSCAINGLSVFNIAVKYWAFY